MRRLLGLVFALALAAPAVSAEAPRSRLCHFARVVRSPPRLTRRLLSDTQHPQPASLADCIPDRTPVSL